MSLLSIYSPSSRSLQNCSENNKNKCPGGKQVVISTISPLLLLLPPASSTLNTQAHTHKMFLRVKNRLTITIYLFKLKGSHMIFPLERLQSRLNILSHVRLHAKFWVSLTIHYFNRKNYTFSFSGFWKALYVSPWGHATAEQMHLSTSHLPFFNAWRFDCSSFFIW